MICLQKSDKKKCKGNTKEKSKETLENERTGAKVRAYSLVKAKQALTARVDDLCME